ncbi:MAG: response regulator, partial [Saprospiraceae bacterium]|nr:response regulator [Saprospiraceae bacterium]
MAYPILIIDDEETLRKLLVRMISLEGYMVSDVANGKSALNLLEKEEFYVVLSDIKLPDISGVELVKHIKALSPETEVICLTAYGTIHDGVQAIKNGAFDYLVKGDDN